MKSIWKFPIEVISQQYLTVPSNSEILDLQLQAGRPHIWLLVDLDATKVTIKLTTYGTGHQLPDDPGGHVGTYQCNGLVLHVFAEE